MSEFDPTEYGTKFADEYDATYEGVFDTEGAVACVADLAGDGPVLELGIGTGRLALPLAAKGVEVHGVDASAEMVDQLRTKPGGAEMNVVIGDFASARIDREFSLVLLAINTIYALPDQDAQVATFENAARHLRPGGLFVVEAWVPDLSRFDRGQGVWARKVSGDRVSVEVAWLDAPAQMMRTTQLQFTDGDVRLYPANHRYAWPSELDLMARLAGMRLRERWQNWQRDPFTNDSRDHVSVYVKT